MKRGVCGTAGSWLPCSAEPRWRSPAGMDARRLSHGRDRQTQPRVFERARPANVLSAAAAATPTRIERAGQGGGSRRREASRGGRQPALGRRRTVRGPAAAWSTNQTSDRRDRAPLRRGFRGGKPNDVATASGEVACGSHRKTRCGTACRGSHCLRKRTQKSNKNANAMMKRNARRRVRRKQGRTD